MNVNGSLKEHKKSNYSWVGIDLEPGKDVDIVLQDPYKFPFNDKEFDVIVASSVFEHSAFFWVLFNEIVRVMAPGGLIYLNAPSNGVVHRYPVDVYRFYPDAGAALREWGQILNKDLKLQESFVADQGIDPWNDFVAVFCDEYKPNVALHKLVPSTNVWFMDKFQNNTHKELVQDLQIINRLAEESRSLFEQNKWLSNRLNEILTSRSWKITRPLRRKAR